MFQTGWGLDFDWATATPWFLCYGHSWFFFCLCLASLYCWWPCLVSCQTDGLTFVSRTHWCSAEFMVQPSTVKCSESVAVRQVPHPLHHRAVMQCFVSSKYGQVSYSETSLRWPSLFKGKLQIGLQPFNTSLYSSMSILGNMFNCSNVLYLGIMSLGRMMEFNICSRDLNYTWVHSIAKSVRRKHFAQVGCGSLQ